MLWGDNNNNNNTTIVGLFAQESRIFVYLHHLLQQQQACTIINHHHNNNNDKNNNRHWQTQVYWLRLPPIPVATPKAMPWYHHHAPVLTSILTMCVMSTLVQEEHFHAVQESLVAFRMYMQDAALDTVKTLQYNLIEWPLQDLYRHGPWFVGGWEGDDLSRICARITLFHGTTTVGAVGDDATTSFWSMNMAECVRIYQGKLQAFLRLARPILVILLGLVVLFLVRFTWWEVQRFGFLRQQRHAAAAQPPGPPAVDMVETYQAFQTLLRQVQRTLALPHPPPPLNGNANHHHPNQPPQQQQRQQRWR